MFQATKRLIVERAARFYVNRLISRYAVLEDLNIDAKNHTIEVICHLHGEKKPVAVKVEKYVIHQKGQQQFLLIEKCTCSRPWVQHIVEDFFEGRRVELPRWALASL